MMGVLKPEFSSIYDAEDGLHINAHSSDHLADEAYGMDRTQLLRLINLDKDGMGMSQLIRHVPEFFAAAKVDIERVMKAMVAAAPGADIYARAGVLAADATFAGLMARQNELFAAFDLWDPAGQVKF